MPREFTTEEVRVLNSCRQPFASLLLLGDLFTEPGLPHVMYRDDDGSRMSLFKLEPIWLAQKERDALVRLFAAAPQMLEALAAVRDGDPGADLMIREAMVAALGDGQYDALDAWRSARSSRA